MSEFRFRSGVGAPPYRAFVLVSMVTHAIALYLLPAAALQMLLSRGPTDEAGVAGDDTHLMVEFQRSALRVIEFQTHRVVPREPMRERRESPPPEQVPPEETTPPEEVVELLISDDAAETETTEAIEAAAAPPAPASEVESGPTQQSGGLPLGGGEDQPEAVVVPPVLVGVVWPEAPAEARRRRRDTTVRLMVHVLSSGKVGEVRVAEPSGCEACELAAIDAARRLRFRPATRGGQSVDAWVPYTVSFKR